MPNCTVCYDDSLDMYYPGPCALRQTTHAPMCATCALSWIDSAQYPRCPCCRAPVTYLASPPSEQAAPPGDDDAVKKAFRCCLVNAGVPAQPLITSGCYPTHMLRMRNRRSESAALSIRATYAACVQPRVTRQPLAHPLHARGTPIVVEAIVLFVPSGAWAVTRTLLDAFAHAHSHRTTLHDGPSPVDTALFVFALVLDAVTGGCEWVCVVTVRRADNSIATTWKAIVAYTKGSVKPLLHGRAAIAVAGADHPQLAEYMKAANTSV